jgi:hypothetical protein
MFQPLRAYGFEISPSGFETPSSPTSHRCAPGSGQCTFVAPRQPRTRKPRKIEAKQAVSKRNEVSALTTADHVCRAYEAGVVRPNDVTELHRIVQI